MPREKKKLPAIVPLQTAKTSHARKQKNPKSSHTIPLLPSRRTFTTAIAWSPEPELKETIDLKKKKTTCSHAHNFVHSFLHAHKKLPSHRTSTTATQIAGAERFWRRRVRRSLETNRSRHEPRSKGLFFMIFPFPQFGFRIRCSDFLFASLESFKFWAFPFWWERRVSVCSYLVLF